MKYSDQDLARAMREHVRVCVCCCYRCHRCCCFGSARRMVCRTHTALRSPRQRKLALFVQNFPFSFVLLFRSGVLEATTPGHTHRKSLRFKWFCWFCTDATSSKHPSVPSDCPQAVECHVGVGRGPGVCQPTLSGPQPHMEEFHLAQSRGHLFPTGLLMK